MVFVSLFSSGKNQLHIGKKEKIQKKIFITLFAKKTQSEKNFDITFSLKRSLHKPRKINEIMNPMKYTSSSKKESRKFFEKN